MLNSYNSTQNVMPTLIQLNFKSIFCANYDESIINELKYNKFNKAKVVGLNPCPFIFILCNNMGNLILLMNAFMSLLLNVPKYPFKLVIFFFKNSFGH